MRTPNNRCYLLPFCFLALFVLFPAALLAVESDTGGEVSGNLLNKTTGERVSNVEVILQRHEGNQERGEEKSVSDNQGNFFFRGLDQREGNSYTLKVVYKGVEYFSPAIVFDKKQRIPLNMIVYDPTDSDREISVVMHHLLAEPKEGALWMRELMIVENRGNKVYVGAREIAPDKKETLRISLPPGAQELQLTEGLMSCCIVEMKNGFSDTMDIKPGRKQFVFAYKLDYRTSSLSLKKEVNQKTDSLDFFIPDRGIQAQGENVQNAGLIGEPGNRFIHFSRKKLIPGSQVVLHLKGLPWGRKLYKSFATILGVTLVGFGLAYPFVRRRRGSSKSKQEIKGEDSRRQSDLQKERQKILLTMAALDDQLDSGKISSEEHERRRRVLKERVIRIIETLQDGQNQVRHQA